MLFRSTTAMSDGDVYKRQVSDVMPSAAPVSRSVLLPKNRSKRISRSPARKSLSLIHIFGCGAVRHLGGLRAEVKRMYVVPEARCQKIRKGILDALEREARRLGVEEMVLETGVRQPRALSLYETAGFVRVPLFGEYVGKPLSVCCLLYTSRCV